MPIIFSYRTIITDTLGNKIRLMCVSAP